MALTFPLSARYWKVINQAGSGSLRMKNNEGSYEEIVPGQIEAFGSSSSSSSYSSSSRSSSSSSSSSISSSSSSISSSCSSSCSSSSSLNGEWHVASTGLKLEPDISPYTGTTCDENFDIVDWEIDEHGTNADYWDQHYSYGVDLGSSKEVSWFDVYAESDGGIANLWDSAESRDVISVYYSDDNITWTFAEQFISPIIINTYSTVGVGYFFRFRISLTSHVTARYFKFVNVSSGVLRVRNYSGDMLNVIPAEIEVFGSSSSSSLSVSSSSSLSSSSSSSLSSSSSSSSKSSSSSISSSSSKSSSSSSSSSSSLSLSSSSSSRSSSSSSIPSVGEDVRVSQLIAQAEIGSSISVVNSTVSRVSQLMVQAEIGSSISVVNSTVSRVSQLMVQIEVSDS